MYECGHSGHSRDELRAVLRRLEEALASHEGKLPAEDHAGAADAPLQALRRSLLLMRQEAELLRAMLAAP